MAVIDILQKIRQDGERLLGELDSSSSRIYEITSTGTIIERTQQLRTFYGSIVRQLGHAIELLGARDAQRHG